MTEQTFKPGDEVICRCPCHNGERGKIEGEPHPAAYNVRPIGGGMLMCITGDSLEHADKGAQRHEDRH